MERRTIVTTDGQRYVNTRVNRLMPGVAYLDRTRLPAVKPLAPLPVPRPDAPDPPLREVAIPFSKLPRELRALYGERPGEFAEVFKNTVDGKYRIPPEQTPFASETIELRKGRFHFRMFSDSGYGADIRGTFTRRGHWIIFPSKSRIAPRILTVYHGRAVLMRPEEFQRVREAGEGVDVPADPLFRE